MSLEGLIRVLGRAVVDKEYLKQIEKNPREAALETTDDLTEKELKFLEMQKVKSALKECSDRLNVEYRYREEKGRKRYSPNKWH